MQNSHISHGQVLTDVKDTLLSRTGGGARRRTACGGCNEVTRSEGVDHVDKIEARAGQQYRNGRENRDLVSQETNKGLNKGDAGVVILFDTEEREKKLKVGGKYMCADCGMSDRMFSITKHLLIV